MSDVRISGILTAMLLVLISCLFLLGVMSPSISIIHTAIIIAVSISTLILAVLIVLDIASMFLVAILESIK